MALLKSSTVFLLDDPLAFDENIQPMPADFVTLVGDDDLLLRFHP